MKIPINISVKSQKVPNDLRRQGGPEQPAETIAYEVAGYMRRTRQGLELEYFENADTGMGETRTLIHLFDDDVVSVSREGEMHSHMVFQEGKSHTCIYNAGPMAMQIRILTKSLSNHLSLDGGLLDIDYTVEIVGNTAERNRLTLAVAPDQSVITS